jgi:hypothetical protein
MQKCGYRRKIEGKIEVTEVPIKAKAINSWRSVCREIIGGARC